jgi:hypothetical protein
MTSICVEVTGTSSNPRKQKVSYHEVLFTTLLLPVTLEEKVIQIDCIHELDDDDGTRVVRGSGVTTVGEGEWMDEDAGEAACAALGERVSMSRQSSKIAIDVGRTIVFAQMIPSSQKFSQIEGDTSLETSLSQLPSSTVDSITSFFSSLDEDHW